MFNPVNKHKRMPAYIQIVDMIKENINNEVWLPHYKLPSEEELAKHFGLARGTIRHAIDILENEDILYRIHGRGTFVSSPIIEHKLDSDRFLTFLEELEENKVPFENDVLYKNVELPNPSIATYLSISDQNDKIFKLRRLRKVNSKPIMLVENHVPYHMCVGIEGKDYRNVPLFFVLESMCNIDVDWSKRIFEARLADKEIAELLEIAEGSPVIFIKQMTYNRKGDCIEFSNFWLRSDRMHLSISLKRRESNY